MKAFKLFFAVALLAVIPSMASAQESKRWNQRFEIVELEDDSEYEIFAMRDNGESEYFLSVGHLGVGDSVVQLQIDPLFNLFVPLGSSLEEALATLLDYKALVNNTDATKEIKAYLAVAVPDEKVEDVTVIARKALLRRYLDFCVQRDGYTRSAYLSKGELNSLILSLRTYKAIHPKEK